MILEALANMYTTKPKHNKKMYGTTSKRNRNKSLSSKNSPYGGFAGYYYYAMNGSGGCTNVGAGGDSGADGGGDGGGGE